MGGPDRPWGWPEQCRRQALCLKEGGAGGVASGVGRVVRDGAADGGGGGSRHGGQVGGDDLCRQRLTLFTERQLDLVETKTKQENVR